MDIKQHNANLDTLESMTDKNDVHYVLETLAEVCSAKADHLRTNWQDEHTARHWEKRCEIILKGAHKVNEIGG